MVDLERLTAVCEQGLDALGYELVDLEYQREPGGWVLRVFIDRPAPGAPFPADADSPASIPPSSITHQDCQVASEHLGAVLDVEDLIDTAYRLEMSSPGVDRPVRKEADFRRFAGHRILVVLHQPREGRRRFAGVLRGIAEGRVALEVDGTVVELELTGIKKARLEVEL